MEDLDDKQIEPDDSSSNNHNHPSTDDYLKVVFHKQKKLNESINNLEQLMQDNSSNKLNDDKILRIIDKLEKIQEDSLPRHAKQLRVIQKQISTVSSVLGNDRYKNLVDRLLSYLDLIKKSQSESNAVGSNVGNADFIGPLYTELVQILNVNDVYPIDVNVGQEFDPKLHNCVFTHPVKNRDDSNKIFQIVKPGYYIKQNGDEEQSDNLETTVLRHTDVVVTKSNINEINTEQEDLLEDKEYINITSNETKSKGLKMISKLFGSEKGEKQ